MWSIVDVHISGGKDCLLFYLLTGVMEYPRGVYGTLFAEKIKHLSFVIVLRTPAKELPKLPIFNSAIVAASIISDPGPVASYSYVLAINLWWCYHH